MYVIVGKNEFKSLLSFVTVQYSQIKLKPYLEKQ